MNYGSLGVIIGHEITHSFDAHGHAIDANGVLRPWWTKESDYRFSKHSLCFQTQYGAYEVRAYKDGNRMMSVNGVRTVSENIADNGGLSVALAAWRMLDGVKEIENKADKALGGLTPLQAFFVAFGQTWCAVPDYAQTRFLVSVCVAWFSSVCLIDFQHFFCRLISSRATLTHQMRREYEVPCRIPEISRGLSSASLVLQ